MARRQKRRSRKMVSESIVTYSRVVDLQGTGDGDTTHLVQAQVSGVSNLSGETTNRKIIRVMGTLMFSSNLGAGHHCYAMFALLAHPEIDGSFPPVADWDPFEDGPGLGADFDGRPSPRPFGRRTFSLVTPNSGGVVEVIQQAFRYSTKAERLLRPGWGLSAGLYLRASDGVQGRVGGILRATVVG